MTYDMTVSDRDKQKAMLESIEWNIAEIRALIRDCSTESVVQKCRLEDRFPHPDLQAPKKQIAFLIGLLLATDEPPTARDFTDRDWENVAKPLSRLFQVYTERYALDREQFRATSISQLKRREIATLAFLDYFFKGTLATAEQLRDHIRVYAVPFDADLSTDLGLSASDALAIVDSIGAKFRAHADRLDSRSTRQEVFSGYLIRRSELIAQHGKSGDTFWRAFTVGRGEGDILHYPTEQSIVECRPFIRLSENVALGCKLDDMLLSLLTVVEACLLGGESKATYIRHRARTPQEQTVSFMRQILGGSARIYQNLFETPDSQNEHDIVVIGDDLCLFVEVKSSPPNEPFRDPEKAYTRLQRSFRSDTGIQKAYDQANRLLQAVRSSESVSLYDRDGNEALQLPRALRDRAYCVCVTKDSYGPISTCLSFLLEKSDGDPYPWAISVWNLENIAEVWRYFRWDQRQLRAYLSVREKLHASLFSDDELDYVGAFILHCGLHHFVSDTVFPAPLNPTYSDIFDDIHQHLWRGAQPVRIVPVHPNSDSAADLLRTGEAVLSMSRRQKPIKLMRNELCPCGSGVKSKRCHGML
ncbi:MAG: SEC-C domain-containing protein [Chloroflexota bacterium]|nr:SEC-C domain-containing protein [Chloroflexota bacterium]